MLLTSISSYRPIFISYLCGILKAIRNPELCIFTHSPPYRNAAFCAMSATSLRSLNVSYARISVISGRLAIVRCVKMNRPRVLLSWRLLLMARLLIILALTSSFPMCPKMVPMRPLILRIAFWTIWVSYSSPYFSTPSSLHSFHWIIISIDSIGVMINSLTLLLNSASR